MFIYIVIFFLFNFSRSNSQFVRTRYGTVRGQFVPVDDGTSGSVISYKGVRYAKPPIGNLRFRPPQDPDYWGHQIADHMRPVCPGDPTNLDRTHLRWSKFDEDCLFLNIYSSADPLEDGQPDPVMLFFHGGEFHAGANIRFPGHFLARRNVIFIAANYRLGHLGFLSTGDKVSPGNYGLLDQLKAMEFVRDNIREFGGDPNRVTIFGQSAGSASIGLHLVSPKSRGMFHSAILQSGSEVAFWAVNEPEQQPAEYSRKVARAVNCTTNSSQEMVDCLRQVPWQQLWDVNFDCKRGYFCLGIIPVIDGAGGFLPEMPQKTRYEGRAAKVPIMGGYTPNDGAGYMALFIPESYSGGINRTNFLRYMKDRLLWMVSASVPANRTDDVMAALSMFYTPWPHPHNGQANRQKLIEMVTDVAYAVPHEYSFRAHAAMGVHTYSYVFDYRSKLLKSPKWFGVQHSDDLPFVFGYPHLAANEAVRNDSEMTYPTPWTTADRLYSNYIMELWTNFAKYHNPTPEPVRHPFGHKDSVWTRFTEQDQRMFWLDRQSRHVTNYRSLNGAFWREHMRYLTGVIYPGRSDLDK